MYNFNMHVEGPLLAIYSGEWLQVRTVYSR